MHHADHHDRQGSSFMMGIMAGTAIGAGLALLLTPRDGRAMRRDLADGAHRLGEQFTHGADVVRERARRVADSASDLIDRGRSAYHDAADEVRHASTGSSIDNAVDDAARSAKRAVRQGADTVERAAGQASSAANRAATRAQTL